MAITEVGSTTTFGSSAATHTSITITKPTGIVSGNFMVASISTNADRTLGGPSGWTLVSTEITGTFSNSLWYKAAGGSEPADYAFTASGGTAAPMVGSIVGLAGVNIVSPLNDHTATTSLTEAEPATGPSITTTVAETRVFYLRAVRDDTATPITFSSAAGGVTELFDDGGFSGVAYSHTLWWDNADNAVAGVKAGIAITANSTETHNVERTFALAVDGAKSSTETGAGTEGAASITGTVTGANVADTNTSVTEGASVSVPVPGGNDTGTGTEGASPTITMVTEYLIHDDFNRDDEDPLGTSTSGHDWTSA